MKHYDGLDLSMETTQACIPDEAGRKIVSEKVEISPGGLARKSVTALPACASVGGTPQEGAALSQEAVSHFVV